MRMGPLPPCPNTADGRPSVPPPATSYPSVAGRGAREAIPYNAQPRSLKSRPSILFLRTAAGGFVNVATIARLCEETDGRWVAICDDDPEAALAAYFNAPGRLRELQHLLPPQDNTNGANLSAADLAGPMVRPRANWMARVVTADRSLTIKPCPKQ